MRHTTKYMQKLTDLLVETDDPNVFPRIEPDNPRVIQEGPTKFCHCGNYHPLWYVEPDTYEFVSRTLLSEYSVGIKKITRCPDTETLRPELATVRVKYIICI